jgi:predicted amidohydrolase YtcJ
MLAELDGLRAEHGRPDVAIRTAKLFFDGVIEHPTQTAALLEPYLVDGAPGDSRGPTYFPQPVADRAVAALDAAGWQVHVHAIGDRAARSALDAFAHARACNGPTGNRHTIAHLELVHPDDRARFGELDVLADLQLQWARRDPYTVEHVAPYLGPERWRDLYPAAALARAGARLCGGSDWPVDPLAPFTQIATAVRRTAPGGDPEPLFPGQALSLRASLAMHTRDAAFQLHQETLTGRIATGLAADLIVLDRDLLGVPLDAVPDAQVELTLVEGRVVRRAG